MKSYIHYYAVLTGDTDEELGKRVNSYIIDGWQPFGGVAVYDEKYCQAVVMYETIPQVINTTGGETALDMILLILKTTNRPIHYRKMFRIAKRSGYTSGREGGGNPLTFWHTLKKHPELFEAVGGGQYKLKPVPPDKTQRTP